MHLQQIDPKNRFAFWLVGIVLLALLGCRPHDLPTKPAVDHVDQDNAVAAAVDANANHSNDDGFERSPFPHPLDQVPQGLLYRRAITAIDEGRLEEADRVRQQLKDHPQFSVLSDAIAGFLLAKAGRSEAAISIAESISRVPVMRVESYLLAGQAFHIQGDWSAAIQAFRGAVSEYKDCVRAHRWLGAILYDTGAMWEAVEHLRTVSRLDRLDTRSLRLAGLIHHDYQQYEEAVRDYRQLLNRSPEAVLAREVRIELANALRELRRYADALDTLAALPDDATVLAARGACHEAAGDIDLAMQVASQAIGLDPRHAHANLIVGRIDHANRRWSEAVERLRIAVEVDPSGHESRFLLGRCLLQAGQTSAGEAEIERATQMRELTLKLAELHLEAIARPSDVDLRLQLGRLAEQLGRKNAAATWYRAALGLQPDHAEAAAAVQRIAAVE